MAAVRSAGDVEVVPNTAGGDTQNQAQTRAERMAEASANAEARKEMIEYFPPTDMATPLDTVKQLSLNEILIKSKFMHLKKEDRPEAVCKEYSKNVKESVIVDAGARPG